MHQLDMHMRPEILVCSYPPPPPPACGVAHQALEEINPRGDDILVQGMYEQ